MLLRHLTLIVPVSAAFALLPGAWWIRLLVPAFTFLASTLLVAVSAEEIRTARLRQHGLSPPPDRGT